MYEYCMEKLGFIIVIENYEIKKCLLNFIWEDES